MADCFASLVVKASECGSVRIWRVLVVTVYVIGYDLHPTKGETYDELIPAIKA
jgi:hypothetical protein